MQYRKLPKGTEQISVLGIGTSSIQVSSEKEIEKIMDAAIESGIYETGTYGWTTDLDTVKADACVGCGHCNSRCPFHVDQMARLKEIADYFS